MTSSDDFIPSNEADFDTEPSYPVVFGITITPLIAGVLLGLLGLAAAAYTLLNFVLPELDRNRQLKQEVADKETQLKRQATIAQRIEAAKKDLAVAKQQQQEVLSLFSSPSTLDTLLLDINKQINRRTPADLLKQREQKLATCAPAIRQNSVATEKAVKGKFVVPPELRTFTPDEAKSGIINDGSYGVPLNNKLKRQVVGVEFVGNYEDTRQILQRIEQLQSLLVVKNATFAVAEPDLIYDTRGSVTTPSPTCQAETEVKSTFQLEALLPLTPDEQKKLNPPAATAQPPAK
jgi:type IV pilus assembly protein PilO